MANDLNSVTLVGRLTRDVDVKYTNNGTAMLRFSIAVNRSRRNADGSWTEEPNYFDCLYTGKSVDSISKYLIKGRQIGLLGELRLNRWTDQEGQNRSRVEIFVNNLELLGSSNQREGSLGQDNGFSSSNYNNNRGYNQGYQNDRVAESAPLHDGPEDFQDDDIPF